MASKGPKRESLSRYFKDLDECESTSDESDDDINDVDNIKTNDVTSHKNNSSPSVGKLNKSDGSSLNLNLSCSSSKLTSKESSVSENAKKNTDVKCDSDLANKQSRLPSASKCLNTKSNPSFLKLSDKKEVNWDACQKRLLDGDDVSEDGSLDFKSNAVPPPSSYEPVTDPGIKVVDSDGRKRKIIGRPRARTEIVNVDQIMTKEEIKSEKCRSSSLMVKIDTNELCMKWLAQRRLIMNTCLCKTCNQLASLVVYRRAVDGYKWRCKNCNFSSTIRAKSFFQRSHLSLKQILIIMYYWSYDLPQNFIQHEAEVNKRTVIDWCNFLREECHKYIVRGSSEIGGMDDAGQPILVEIDKTEFFHRKYHRDQWHEGHWVFGGIERVSGKCFLVEVPDRTEDTLTREIIAHILPGSHIVSDGWCAYANISRIANGVYIHSTIIHQENFVDPDNDEVHMQNIKNMWMRAKRKLKRQFGTSRALFPSYLNEFAFRNYIRLGSIFGTLLTGIGESYPV